MEHAKERNTFLFWNVGMIHKFHHLYNLYNKIWNYSLKNRDFTKLKRNIFNEVNSEVVSSIILDRKPSHVFLFERPDEFKGNFDYKFTKLLKSPFHNHNTGIFSNEAFQVVTCETLNKIIFSDKIVYPCHLATFSSKTRNVQIKNIIADISHETQRSKKDIIIAGDFNFHRINMVFLFKNDCETYELLIKTVSKT